MVIGSGGGFGCCRACGGKLTFSSGWVPTYGDPDNASGAPEAAPVCEKCEAEFERENLRNYEPMSRSATVMPIRLLPNIEVTNARRKTGDVER